MVAPSVVPGSTYQPIERVNRLLFSWRADELALKALTGEPGTFARSGLSGTAVDLAGRLYPRAYAQPVFEMTDEDGDGRFERPWLRIEPARTNLCLWSEDFGQWTATGTPTRVAAALVLGSVALDLIGDNDGAVAEFYSRVVAFTGNAVKAISVTMARGLNPNPSGSVIRLRQTSGTPADRLLATVTWNADGSPNVAPTTGLYFGVMPAAGGAVRLLFQTTSVTAAETHQLEVRPTTLTAAETGDVFAGAVQAEDAEFPSSYTPTLGVSASKVGETLNYDIGFAVQPLTIYGEWNPPYPTSYNGGGSLGVAALGNAWAGATEEAVLIHHSGTTFFAEHASNSGGVTSGVTDFSALVKPLRWAAQLYADGSIQVHLRDKSGLQLSGTRSAARGFVHTVFAGNKVWLGSRENGIFSGGSRHRALKVAAGVVDLSPMAGML